MKDQLTINRARVTKQGVETKTTQDGRPMARFTAMWSSSRKDKTDQ